MKILFVANTDNHINLCYIPYLKYLKEQGHTIHVATNTDIAISYCDSKIKISIHRTPFHFSNIRAIKQLKKIIIKEEYDMISASTPMGGCISRLAVRHLKKRPKILYTAHGFHFFYGNSKFKNLLYYSIEKYLAKYTDILVTINKEDYNIAKEKFKTCVKYVPGIGFNCERLNNTLTKSQKKTLKQELGLKDEYVILYVAELSKRKRQLYLLDTIKEIKMDNYKLLLVGGNILGNKIGKKIKAKKLEDKVKVLGFREDISDLLDISNLVISVSSQEGLPLNIMEAMYKNKPIIVTDCRGNRDLIINNKNGIVVPLNNPKILNDAILKMKDDPKYARKLSKNNKKLALSYSIDKIILKYIEIYNELI